LSPGKKKEAERGEKKEGGIEEKKGVRDGFEVLSIISSCFE